MRVATVLTAATKELEVVPPKSTRASRMDGRPAADRALDMAERALRLYETSPARAEQLATRALHAVTIVGNPKAESTALQALGMIAWERQAIPAAMEALRSAIVVAEAAGELVTGACARSRLAIVLSYAGDDAGALAQAERAAPFLIGVSRAELLHHMAGILEREGRLREALALATKALRSFRRFGDVLWQAKALNNRGIILAQLGETGLAKQQFEQAERLYAQLGTTLGRLKTRNNRAWLASLHGDVLDALRLHDGLQRELTDLGVPPGLFRLDHAAVLLAASLHAEALVAAEQAAAELADEGMLLDRAEALLVACVAARLAGAFERAERLARSATSAFLEQQRPAWALRAQHALLEILWVTRRHDAATEALARTIADELAAAGWRDWARDVHLLVGHLAVERGDLAEASRRLQLAKSGAQGWNRAAAAANLQARVYYARGERANARRAVRRGLRYLEEHEAILGATELRVRAARQAAELADLGLRWAVTSGRPANVLAWAERRRAASLRLPPVRPPRDRALAKLLATRRATSFSAEQIERTQLEQNGPYHDPSRTLATLDVQIRDRTRSTQGHGLAVSFASISRAALAAALGSRALVELVVVDDDLSAVVVVDGRCTFQPLTSMLQVQTELTYTRFAIARASVATNGRGVDPLVTSLARLDALIGWPLARIIGQRELVVVPVAALHTLPWGSLPSLRDRPVSVAPSATTWLTAQSRPRHPRGRTVVVAGPGLDHAESEAAAVSRITAAHQTLIAESATAEAVTKALDGASVAHLACHGRYRADNPMFSSLLLFDGPVTVYELERLRRAPDLVVLSACDSAVGEVSAGEELMGLTASLLALGCRTLVGSIASVEDASTRPLMLAFHDRLAAGETPAAALARARGATPANDPAAFATAVAFGCFGAGS
jgi:hypothetical protein